MQKPDQFVLVIFGASGDLALRKLIPALYHLYRENIFPPKFRILGTGRKAFTDASFADLMRATLEKLPQAESREALAGFCEHLAYQQANPDVPADYVQLRQRLESLSGRAACESNYLYYFAIPPFTYGLTAENLYNAGLTCSQGGWKRVIIEKPFGRDLESATSLNNRLLHFFKEEQIYRIDHYLGKETVQNMLVTRFSNSIFEPLWNRNFIEYVEITSAEALGVGSRAGYYESAGALRDMLQNHLLQLLAIVAMEPPMSADATFIRNEMVKVFHSIRKIKRHEVAANVIRGQYVSSLIKGKEQKGYREEVGIAPDSKTETYVALKCYIDNWRWSGVPFYIRTGKCLPTRVTEVVIHFRPAPHTIFGADNCINCAGNQLIIRIQPDEGVQLKMGMKRPGSGFEVEPVSLDFKYSSLSNQRLPEAYERLIYDCMVGDATLYQRNDAVQATWEFVQPILEAWAKEETPIYGYPAGSWGPEEADGLLAREGFSWRFPCKNLTNSEVYCEL